MGQSPIHKESVVILYCVPFVEWCVSLASEFCGLLLWSLSVVRVGVDYECGCVMFAVACSHVGGSGVSDVCAYARRSGRRS